MSGETPRIIFLKGKEELSSLLYLHDLWGCETLPQHSVPKAGRWHREAVGSDLRSWHCRNKELVVFYAISYRREWDKLSFHPERSLWFLQDKKFIGHQYNENYYDGVRKR